MGSAVYELLSLHPRGDWAALVAEWDREYRQFLSDRGWQGARVLLKLKTFGIQRAGAPPDFPE
eukprot:10739174-Alexandrium_andersonii.AAC.1